MVTIPRRKTEMNTEINRDVCATCNTAIGARRILANDSNFRFERPTFTDKNHVMYNVIYDKLVVKSTNICVTHTNAFVASQFCCGRRVRTFLLSFCCYRFLFSTVDCIVRFVWCRKSSDEKSRLLIAIETFYSIHTHYHHHISIFLGQEMGLHRTAENSISINSVASREQTRKNVDIISKIGSLFNIVNKIVLCHFIRWRSSKNYERQKKKPLEIIYRHKISLWIDGIVCSRLSPDVVIYHMDDVKMAFLI